MSERIAISLLVLVAMIALVIKSSSLSRGRTLFPEEAPDPPPTSMVVVTGASVNLRAGPGLSHAVAAQRVGGDQLEMIGIQGDWYNVLSSGRSLWISKLYASPASDCSGERAVAADDLTRLLIGEWKGEVGNQEATLVLYAQDGSICGYVVVGKVKEALTVSTSSTDRVLLVGHRFEHLAGGGGGFSLDRFSGHYERTSGRLSGTYHDAGQQQGRWFAERGDSVKADLTDGEPVVPEREGRRRLDRFSVSPRGSNRDRREGSGAEVVAVPEAQGEHFPISVDQSMPTARTTRTGSAILQGVGVDRVYRAAYQTMLDAGYLVVEANSTSGELRGFKQHSPSEKQTWSMSIEGGDAGLVSLIIERGTTGDMPPRDHVVLLKYVVGSLRDVSRDEVLLNIGGEQRRLSEW